MTEKRSYVSTKRALDQWRSEGVDLTAVMLSGEYGEAGLHAGECEMDLSRDDVRISLDEARFAPCCTGSSTAFFGMTDDYAHHVVLDTLVELSAASAALEEFEAARGLVADGHVSDGLRAMSEASALAAWHLEVREFGLSSMQDPGLTSWGAAVEAASAVAQQVLEETVTENVDAARSDLGDDSTSFLVRTRKGLDGRPNWSPEHAGWSSRVHIVFGGGNPLVVPGNVATELARLGEVVEAEDVTGIRAAVVETATAMTEVGLSEALALAEVLERD